MVVGQLLCIVFLLLYPLFYPFFCAEIQGDETALAALNEMKPGAGEYRSFSGSTA